ncbi:hypothetical protein LG299_06545 [Microbacterium lacus]|uniref:hypothetical protein n=1 Tax=Microbacterium lacus TaxID=415217 RepID=UPI0038500C83
MNEKRQDAEIEYTPRVTDAVEIEVKEAERPRMLRPAAGTRAARHDRLAEVRGVTWMRISDAVAMGGGKVAGRGLNLEAAFVRSIRRQPAVTRRAISERAHHLAPLASFGSTRRIHSVGRDAMGRG